MKTAAVVLFGCLILMSSGPAVGDPEKSVSEIDYISMEELRSRLNTPGTVILDVRDENQWRVSKRKLPGAIHEDPAHVATWSKKYSKTESLVFY